MSEMSSNLISEFSTKSLPKIPEAIIEEIILRLPAKSILKFRCVSPSWLSLLDSPYFLKTYVSKSANKIILITRNSFYSLDINIKPTPQISILNFCYPHSNTLILGSCNGMLLTYHCNTGNPLPPLKHRWDVFFQNPYTRTFEKMPFLQYNCPGSTDKFVYGFWYDHLTDDYKVFSNCLFYSCVDGEPFYSQVNVYSLKMKSFKQIDPFPYYVKYELPGNILRTFVLPDNVFCGGALHWVVSTSGQDKSQWICAFDVVNEKYGLIEQPSYSRGDFKLTVHALGGCLSVVCSYLMVARFDVWVMKEYGNVASWSSEISIKGADIGVETYGYLKPISYSECGNKVLIEIGITTLLWYDLEKKSAEIVGLDDHQVPEHFQAFVHKESLVKLGCGCPGDEKREVDKMPKKRDDFLAKGIKLKL